MFGALGITLKHFVKMFSWILVLALALLIPTGTNAFGWSWFFPRQTTTTTASSGTTSATSSNAVPSMYNISIGNRENTNASIDYGTMITNLQINLARFNGSAMLGDATENRLNEVIYTVLEGYRNRSEAMVDSRLAWIDEVLLDIVQYARQLRQDENNRWLKQFPEHVRTSVAQLNETVRSCLEREVVVEELIHAVENRSRSGCLEGRLQKLFELREVAKNNLTEFLASAGDLEDRLETCVNPDFDDALDNVYQEACISSVRM